MGRRDGRKEGRREEQKERRRGEGGKGSTRDRARLDHYPAGLSFPTTNSSINCKLPRTTGALKTHNISSQNKTNYHCINCFQIQESTCSNSLKIIPFCVCWKGEGLIFQGQTGDPTIQLIIMLAAIKSTSKARLRWMQRRGSFHPVSMSSAQVPSPVLGSEEPIESLRLCPCCWWRQAGSGLRTKNENEREGREVLSK